MKLLPPKELNTKINDQKKSEYDAGMFLAKKVDHLREELAETEKSHRDTIERLKVEFAEFSYNQSRKKEDILKEIKILEETRKLLRVPLDDEWQKVKKEGERNTDFSLKLIERDFQLKKDESKNFILSKELDSRKKQLEDSEISIANNLKIAQDGKTQADKILNEVNQYREKINQEIKERIEFVAKRENYIGYKELDIKNQLQIINTSKEEINRERKSLEMKKRRWTI